MQEAAETGRPEGLLEFLERTLQREVIHRIAEVTRLGGRAREDLPSARRYVQAMLGFQVWSNNVDQAMRARPHARGTHTEVEDHTAA